MAMTSGEGIKVSVEQWDGEKGVFRSWDATMSTYLNYTPHRKTVQKLDLFEPPPTNGAGFLKTPVYLIILERF